MPHDRARLEEALRAADAAGDTAAATALAQALRETPAAKPGFTDKLGVANFGVAAADVALSGANQALHQIAGTVRGLGGALPSGLGAESYAEGRALVRDREGDLGPRTGAGKELAENVGKAMRFTGLPQALEWLNTKLDENASPEVADAVRTGATVASLGLPATRAARVAPRAGAAGRAVEAVQTDGYLVPPHRPTGPAGEVAGNTSANVRGALSSHSVNDAKLAIANQDVTQRWAARANEIDGEISPESIQAAIKRSEEPYQELRDANLAVHIDKQFLDDVMSMGGRQDGVGVRMQPDAAVERLQTALVNASRQSTASIIDDVRNFRSKGYRQLNSQDAATQDIGSAHLAAADALDSLLDRSLQRTASMAERAAPTEAALYKRLHAAYVEGRRRRADLHILEEATNAAGEVDAKVIHRIGAKRQLNENYARIARAYEIAPDAMQRVDRASRTARQSSFTMAPSTISGIGSMIARFASRRKGAAAPRVVAPRRPSAARYAPAAVALSPDNSGGGR